MNSVIKPSLAKTYLSPIPKFFESDFIRKVSQTFLTRIGLIIIGMGTSILVARILGPEGRGFYAIAGTISSIGIQFLNLGLHSSNTYYVAKDRSLLATLIGNSLVVSFLIGGLSAILGFLIFQLFPSLNPVPYLLLILSLISIPLGLAYLLGQNLLIGVNLVSEYNKIELLSKLLNVALIVFLLLFQKVSAIFIFLTGIVTVGVGLLWTYGRLISFNKQTPKISFPIFKSNFGYGLKAYIAAFFAYLVLRIDLLMIQYFLGSEEVGYYSISANIADLLLLLPTVVGTILFPKLSKIESIQEKWNLTKKTILILGIIMSLILFLVYCFAFPLIQLMFGTPFLPSVPALIYLLPGIGFFSVNIVLMNYFASKGMPSITMISPGIASLLNILLNIELIPRLGIIGASLCSSISYSLMLGLSIIYLLYFQKKGLFP